MTAVCSLDYPSSPESVQVESGAPACLKSLYAAIANILVVTGISIIMDARWLPHLQF